MGLNPIAYRLSDVLFLTCRTDTRTEIFQDNLSIQQRLHRNRNNYISRYQLGTTYLQIQRTDCCKAVFQPFPFCDEARSSLIDYAPVLLGTLERHLCLLLLFHDYRAGLLRESESITLLRLKLKVQPERTKNSKVKIYSGRGCACCIMHNPPSC